MLDKEHDFLSILKYYTVLPVTYIIYILQMCIVMHTTRPVYCCILLLHILIRLFLKKRASVCDASMRRPREETASYLDVGARSHNIRTNRVLPVVDLLDYKKLNDIPR